MQNCGLQLGLNIFSLLDTLLYLKALVDETLHSNTVRIVKICTKIVLEVRMSIFHKKNSMSLYMISRGGD